MEGVPYPVDQNTDYPSTPTYPQQTYPPHQSYTIQQYPPQLPGYVQSQQPSYPPQLPGYVQSQQPSYPPQLPGYVQSQQPGYPPQVSGYLPAAPIVPIAYPVGGYKGDAPPPYYAHQQALPQQQQSSTNFVLVQQQPTAAYTRRVNASGDNFLTLSVVLTILCFLCGTWYSLLCTVPAIIFASAAKEAEIRGDLAKARQKRNAAIFCNIQACVWWVMITLILIIVPFVMITTRCATCSDQSL